MEFIHVAPFADSSHKVLNRSSNKQDDIWQYKGPLHYKMPLTQETWNHSTFK